MSPAIISPLTHEDYCKRFNRIATTARSIFLVQLMHPRRNLPYRAFVMLQSKQQWIVQWCEQVPASNYALERMRQGPPTPAHYWMKEDARITKEPFEDIITAFCAGAPESIPWQAR